MSQSQMPEPGATPALEAEALLAVEGMHCAACVQLIDLRVGALRGVIAVEASLATHRVRVRWAVAQAGLQDIMAALARAGYRAWPVLAHGTRAANDGAPALAQRRAQRSALWRLFVGGFSMMQVMMYAFPAYLALDGEMSADIDTLLKIASFVLTVPVLGFSAAPLYRGAWRDLRAHRICMDVPVVAGLSVTFLASTWSTFIAPGPVYYDSVSMFVFFLLGARYLEALARERASGAIDALASAQPATALRFDTWQCGLFPAASDAASSSTLPAASPTATLTASPATSSAQAARQVAAESLRAGDHVLVQIGASVPADGVVVQGASLNDEALLTGESRPLTRSIGDAVTGGAINLTAPLVVRVTAAGPDSRASAIMRMMEQAANRKPALLQLAERHAGPFLAAIMALALIAALAWWQIEPARALWVAVAVLIVTCPCALSLAAPAAQAAAIGNLARHGVLVTQGHALETLARANHFVFDKTGTLTTGRMQLIDTVVLGDREGRTLGEVDLLRLAGRLEAQAVHPVAQALAMAAAPLMAAGRQHPGTNDPQLTDVIETPGAGIEARLNGRRVRIGSSAFAAELHGQPFPDQTASRLGAHTLVALADEAGWLGAFALGDGIRAGAQGMVAALREAGCRVTMLTGDNLNAARRVAAAVGIDDIQAAMTPAQKTESVAELQRAGTIIAMVGDGVNDAPVLAQAHISIAMGSGAPLAQTRSDMVLMSTRPADLVHALRVARRSVAVVRQNIVWAAAYNLVAIPLAVAGVLKPWMAGLGMAMSSLIVVGNSMRLWHGAPHSAPASTQNRTSSTALQTQTQIQTQTQTRTQTQTQLQTQTLTEA